MDSRIAEGPGVAYDFGRTRVCAGSPTELQAKLTVSAPGDKYEREADRIAGQVMRKASAGPQCSCGGECPNCREQAAQTGQAGTRIQTKRLGGDQTGERAAPAIVGGVLRSPGQPLDPAARSFMESRFGHDFGSVRVHVGPQAAESARAVQAVAYASGRDIVFGAGQYAPQTSPGRRLLAHELVHVIQQTNRSSEATPEPSPQLAQAPPVGVQHHSPGPRLSRQNTQQTANVLGRGAVANVQFVFNGTMNSTRVGPVSGAMDVSVMVGRLTTIRQLAQVLLPLWNTATPFTPAGGGAPVAFAPLTADELAQGLLVYNRYRLAIPPAAAPPVMTNWKIGMRFPLPIRIDSATNEGVLHPDPIQRMSGSFNAQWSALLDALPAVLPAQPAADLQQSVAAFLAANPSDMARGIHLGARATANAQDSHEFVLEAFNQVGAGAFDLALAFMDWRVNRDISILAAQSPGAAILARIRALIAAPPANPTPAQQSSLNRANNMLGLVTAVQALPDPCLPNRNLTWANFTGAVPGNAAQFTGAATHFQINHVAFQGTNLFQAVLNQAASWGRPRFTQPGNVAVNGCQPNITACQNFFNGGPGPGAQWNHPGGAVGCAAAIGPPATTANNFGQCATVVGAACTTAAQLDSVRLLAHEQLHFDIPCILAAKANATVAGGTALSLAAVRARANTLTAQYDTQTNHGCNAGPQATWATNIAAGLPAQTFP